MEWDGISERQEWREMTILSQQQSPVSRLQVSKRTGKPANQPIQRKNYLTERSLCVYVAAECLETFFQCDCIAFFPMDSSPDNAVGALPDLLANIESLQYLQINRICHLMVVYSKFTVTTSLASHLFAACFETFL